jgi:MFS family permease
VILARLPFFYGWVVVAVAFVTMGIGVTARTAFSLFFPPLLDEFGWERGVTAGAFSLGFIASTVFAPGMGRLMDMRGPRAVILLGVALVGGGLALASLTRQPLHLYLTLGLLVSGGSLCLGYTVHALFLPNWFVRRRGLAFGIAFSGVGAGSIVLLPWVQRLIGQAGWRYACLALAVLVFGVLTPLNLLQRRRPEDLGLQPDGESSSRATSAAQAANVVDPAWAATDWTLARAAGTARFWWLFVGFLGGLFAWYAVQVHQTKYLTEIGFTPSEAAWALGLVPLLGVAGQIGLGHVSDRIGREWVWTFASLGFVLCYALLLLMGTHPSRTLLYLMVGAQGLLGYGLASVFGAIPAELFQGRHYGTIFGTLTVASTGGAGLGPWVTGLLYDRTGSYVIGFWLAIGWSIVSAVAMWLAAPRKVRAVAGRARATASAPPAAR